MTTLPKRQQRRNETSRQLYRRLGFVEAFLAFMLFAASIDALVEGDTIGPIIGTLVGAMVAWDSFSDYRTARRLRGIERRVEAWKRTHAPEGDL